MNENRPFPPLKFHAPTKQHYFWDRDKKDRHHLGRDYSRARERYDKLKKDYDERARHSREPVSLFPRKDDVSVSALLIAYFRHRRAEGTGRRDLHRLKAAIRFFRRKFGEVPAATIRARHLREVRSIMLMAKKKRGKLAKDRKAPQRITRVSGEGETLSRVYVNRLVSNLRCAWVWAAGEDLVPAEGAFSLQAVRGLRKGAGGREILRVTDIDSWAVEATIPELQPTIAAMVCLQQLSGMRPGELCKLRRRDISTSPDEKVPLPETNKRLGASKSDGVLVWLAIPESHKTLWRGHKPRAIVLGPKCQEILRPLMERRGPDDYLFSPREASEAWRLAKKRKIKYGKGREPGDRYTTGSYGRSIAYAIERANRKRAKADPTLPTIPPWRPNQLRHSAATEISERFDRPTAAAVLGHTGVDVITIYCEQELKKAMRVAAVMG